MGISKYEIIEILTETKRNDLYPNTTRSMYRLDAIRNLRAAGLSYQNARFCVEIYQPKSN